jgi:hypothetical protein
MNVQVVKLITGEEIIADVSRNKDKLVLTNAMLVAVQEGRLVFIPYMQYTDASKEFELSESHVMFATIPVDSLIDDYESATTKVTKPRKSITSSVP